MDMAGNSAASRSAIDRGARLRFEERFSASRMAADYTELYRGLARSGQTMVLIADDDFVPILDAGKPKNTA